MLPLYAHRLTAHVDRGMSSPAMWDGCPVAPLSLVRVRYVRVMKRNGWKKTEYTDNDDNTTVTALCSSLGTFVPAGQEGAID